eukprot:TRINITY_DN30818_c0_g1_i1.p1 TRINITY_DN30818_c0_g1~~TRINITY_DN30818_c0_g1_i1.p1  ORF type:complete len:701 (+),score=155.30 TRINITY_DN30818_c0_g1_i1:41-2143(+)
MVFTVLAAADIFSTKLNYEFDFPVQPTLAEFQSRVDSVFGMEAVIRKPANVPSAAFLIHRMQIFDDKTDRWNDLVSGTQLLDYCQVYIFQKETAWHKEVQSKIPPAVKAPSVPQVSLAVPVAAAPPPATFPPLPAVISAQPLPATATYTSLSAGSLGAGTSLGAAGTSGFLPSAALHALPAAAPVPASVASATVAAAALNPVPVASALAPSLASLAAPAPVLENLVPQVVHSLPMPEAMPEECTFDSKVRATFDAFGHVIDYEAFATTLAKVRVDLLDETVRDIFSKADADMNGLLSFGEYQRFAEGYPTLLDSLFYRINDHTIDIQQQDSVAAAKRMVSTLRERESDARVAAVQCQREAEEQVHRLRQQEAEVLACEAREADGKAVLEASVHEVERAQTDVATGRHEVVKAKENEQLKQMAHLDTQRNVELASNKLRTLENDTLRAEERKCEIERLLLEQQKEVDRHRDLSLQARTELVARQTAEQQAADAVRNAEMGSKLATETLQQLESGLSTAQARERDCSQLLIAVREELARNMVARDNEELELQACKEREAVKVALEGEASRACDAQHEHAQMLEKENLEHNVRRRQTEEKERPLLEQEVRLRLQRQNLEAEEARLRDDHRSFHSTMGRAGPPAPTASGLSYAVAPSLRTEHVSPIRERSHMTPMVPASLAGSPARRGLSPHIRRASPPTSPRV